MLRRRFGGDREEMEARLTKHLYPIREKILSHAHLADGETLLDVGCGDGLIGFGALERVKTSKVIFSDISDELLAHTQSLASDLGFSDRCEFLHASADDLSAVPTDSADVIAMRSVLIYVSAKQRAFDEFFRVLRSRGRLSIFEPINSFAYPEPPHLFNGCDMTSIMELTAKVKAVCFRAQPPDKDPMFNFDERDLVAFTEKSGFGQVHLELQVEVKPLPPDLPNWETFVRIAPNPKMPTLEEAIAESLTSDEAEKFVGHLRPLIEARRGTTKTALAYLWASKN
jgi:SAM-dependent methyltransferase